jgi:hypothetical protein
MYLVPYIHTKTKCGDVFLHSLQVFLADGGNSFWLTEESAPSLETIRKEYCEENGIFVKNIHRTEQFAFCEVDSQRTRLDEFYKWNETKQECWRMFSFFADKEGKIVARDTLESFYLGIHSAAFVCSEVLRLVS